jgi:hypothetical protein
MNPSFWQIISFRPYQNHLLNSKGRVALIIMTIIALIMVGIEGGAWGYIFANFIPKNMGLASQITVGIIAGGIVFFALWSFDNSYITQDTEYETHQKLLYQSIQNPPTTHWKQLLNALRKGPAAMALFRGGIAVASMWITAPYFSQMIFQQDLVQSEQRENTSYINKARETLTLRHEKSLQSLLENKNQLEANLITETSGKAGSGKYGNGPVAKAIRENIARKEQEILAQRRSNTTELNEFNAAVAKKDFNALARWDILTVNNTPQARQERLQNEIKNNPQLARQEMLIKAGLMLLVGIFIVFKLTQPASLKIYFSDTLQQEWQLYVAGNYDAWLEPQEQSAHATNMTPNRFEQLMISLLENRRQAEAHRNSLQQLAEAKQKREAEEIERKRQCEVAEAEATRKFEAEQAQKKREEDAAAAEAQAARQQAEQHYQRYQLDIHGRVGELDRLDQGEMALSRHAKTRLETELENNRRTREAMEAEKSNQQQLLQQHQETVAKCKQAVAAAERLHEDLRNGPSTLETMQAVTHIAQGLPTLRQKVAEAEKTLHDLQARFHSHVQRLHELAEALHLIQAQLAHHQRLLDHHAQSRQNLLVESINVALQHRPEASPSGHSTDPNLWRSANSVVRDELLRAGGAVLGGVLSGGLR